MAIHTRRPQDPPNLPKITIGSPPALPDDAADAAVRAAGRRREHGTAAEATAGATVPRTSDGRTRGGKPGSAIAREPWFVSLLLSVVPLLAIAVLPPSAMPMLLGIAAVFVVGGVVMFVRGS